MSELAMNNDAYTYAQDKIHGRIDALHRHKSKTFARKKIYSNGNDQTV
jgi:hypothetical protein